jgi:hypothetical protein
VTSLADLYDGDRRTRDRQVADLAARVVIPHPLHGIRYADGAEVCTHARRCRTVTGQPAR